MRSVIFKKIINILPWLVAGLIFYYLFKKNPPAMLWANLKFAYLPGFVVLALVYFIFLTVWDCVGLSWVLGRFGLPVTVKEMLMPRIGSYLPAIINYNAGQAMLAYYLKKTHDYPPFKSLGSIGFLMLADLSLVILLATASSLMGPVIVRGIHFNPIIQKLGLCFILGLIFFFFAKRYLFSKKIRSWFKSKNLFYAITTGSALDFLWVLLLRLPIHLTLIGSLYLLVHLFQGSIELLPLVMAVPIAVMVAAVPVTPGGLGSLQIAIVELLKTHVSSPLFAQGQSTPEQFLFTISLTWVTANYFIKAIAGLIVLRKLNRL